MPSTTYPYPTDLEQLLLEKSFEELDLHERAWVLTEMNAETYQEMREIALLASHYLERPNLRAPQPRPETKAFLHQKLAERKTVQGQMRQLLDYRIPVWQAAAVGLILCLLQFGRPAFSPIPNGIASQSQLADSTFSDSSYRRVLDMREDSVFSRLQRETDTL